MDYKELSKLMEEDIKRYVMAQIYSQICDMQELNEEEKEAYVKKAYSMWSNNDHQTSEDFGLAIYHGIENLEDSGYTKDQIEQVISYGFELLY